MTEDLRITFGPAGGGGLSLQVQGSNQPVAGSYFPRAALELNALEIERFRRGDMNAQEVDALGTRVNSWLLDAELRQVIGHYLGGVAGKHVRMVFVIPDETRDQVTNLPLELLWHDTPAHPLVLRQDVDGLVYVLSKMTSSPSNRAASTWPFKVLIVRPNPPDLGGNVPDVAGLRDHVLAHAGPYGKGNVQVDVLSGEAGIGKPATWQALLDHLKLTSDYNILVYLGHGELTELAGRPTGQLFMESADGAGHQPISAPMIARLLSRYPIPVAILTGCLTAAQAADAPKRAGGEEGVAQTLVNSSEAGVQVAVGMRMELTDNTPIKFLEAFFSSLLNQQDGAGNIDRAVWQGRNELFLGSGLFPPHWAAPVVFRSLEHEPFIAFLTKPTGFPVTRDMQKFLDIRAVLWETLAGHSVSQGQQLVNAVKPKLLENEQFLIAEGLKQGPLLLPHHAIIAAGQQDDVTVDLAGPLSVSRLRARVTVSGEGVTIEKITPAPPLLAAGFRLLTDADDPAFLEIGSQSGATVALPAGALLTLKTAVAPTAMPGLFLISLQVEEIAPQAAVWAGDNLIAVPKP